MPGINLQDTNLPAIKRALSVATVTANATNKTKVTSTCVCGKGKCFELLAQFELPHRKNADDIRFKAMLRCKHCNQLYQMDLVEGKNFRSDEGFTQEKKPITGTVNEYVDNLYQKHDANIIFYPAQKTVTDTVTQALLQIGSSIVETRTILDHNAVRNALVVQGENRPFGGKS